MKVEQKFFDFFVKKHKLNKNVKRDLWNENVIFFTVVETEIERCFLAKQIRKRKFLFPVNTIFFVLWLFCMANLAGLICDLDRFGKQVLRFT
jgi:hypothetical protein